MADPGATGGPGRDDIKNTQTLKEQFASVKNTLEDVARILQRDIGTEILHMTESVQGFDEAAAKVAKGTLKDLTKELLMAAKAVEKTKLTSEGLTKGFVNSKKYQESIVALKARQSSIESNLLSLEMQGVQVSDDSLGNVKAANKALAKAGLTMNDIDIIELNEAFAAQSLACIRSWGLKDDDARINPNGGAIALGHPLGMSGARILLSAAIELQEQNKRYALVTMCIGVGQGFAVIIEKV